MIMRKKLVNAFHQAVQKNNINNVKVVYNG